VNCPLYLVKMTGPASARVLADKRHQGAVVYGEVTAAALATASQGDKGSWSHGAAFLTSPPLRPNPETPEMLMDMLSRWKLNQTGGKRVGSVWGDV
jgi:dihydropyrimidinase